MIPTDAIAIATVIYIISVPWKASQQRRTPKRKARDAWKHSGSRLLPPGNL